jgi:PPOX class probable F420-dependent enzyme
MIRGSNPAAGEQHEIPDTLQGKIEQARVARLATLDAGRRPHIVPVCFTYDGRVFYTAIDQKPKRVAPERLARLRNIRAVSQVAILIDKYDEDWTQLWYILIRGTAELVPRSAHNERVSALGRLRAKYPQYAGKMLVDDAPIIRITPNRTTFWSPTSVVGV